MTVFWWLTAIVLMAIGLIGTVVPAIPGTTIILGAAVIHRLALGPNGSVGWTALLALVALTLVTYAVDAAAGYDHAGIRGPNVRAGGALSPQTVATATCCRDDSSTTDAGSSGRAGDPDGTASRRCRSSCVCQMGLAKGCAEA